MLPFGVNNYRDRYNYGMINYRTFFVRSRCTIG